MAGMTQNSLGYSLLPLYFHCVPSRKKKELKKENQTPFKDKFLPLLMS